MSHFFSYFIVALGAGGVFYLGTLLIKAVQDKSDACRWIVFFPIKWMLAFSLSVCMNAIFNGILDFDGFAVFVKCLSIPVINGVCTYMIKPKHSLGYLYIYSSIMVFLDIMQLCFFMEDSSYSAFYWIFQSVAFFFACYIRRFFVLERDRNNSNMVSGGDCI